MGTLDLAVELRGSALDVGMTDALILDMQAELSLELMPVVGPDLLDAERELFNDVIDKVDRVGLCVFVVDLECPDAGRIVDGSILEPSDFLAALADEGEELDVLSNKIAWCLRLVVAFSIRVTSSRLSTVGSARGCFTRRSLRVRSCRSSVRV